jgi:dolichol kinase
MFFLFILHYIIYFMIKSNILLLYYYILYYITCNTVFVEATENIARIDITIDNIRLSNILYGSTEQATLRCSPEFLSHSTNSPFSNSAKYHYNTTLYAGSLVLNGFGARFISMPKKNYRFNMENSSLILINAIEPGRIITSLINTLSGDAGGNTINQKYVELYINTEYNGLYYTKYLPKYTDQQTFKIETDTLPANYNLLKDINIRTNVDDSYHIFSYIISLFAVSDITSHNYIITRKNNTLYNNVSYGIIAWDTDLSLGAPTKSPLPQYNTMKALGSIFMANRLMDQHEEYLDTAIFHGISSPYGLYNINSPANLSEYKNNYILLLKYGALSITNLTFRISEYSDQLETAISRDEQKWNNYYCPNDNLFSIDYLTKFIKVRHTEVLNRLTNNITNTDIGSTYTKIPYQYCNYVSMPNVSVIIIIVFTIILNIKYKNKLGSITGISTLVAYLIFNRFDLVNIAPIIGINYLQRNDIISLLLSMLLLIVFAKGTPSDKNTKYGMLFIYTGVSIILSVFGIIETIQLGKLSKTHQTISSTGKILVDTSIFDVRRGELLFVIFIYWKLICQLIFAQITMCIPNICSYTPSSCQNLNTLTITNRVDISYNTKLETQRNKKAKITKFIYFNMIAFTIALIIIFIVYPPNMNAVEVIIQISSAIISALVLFNLRGIYVILKWAILTHYNILPESINAIMSTRNLNTWNLDQLLITEQMRMNNTLQKNEIELAPKSCSASDITTTSDETTSDETTSDVNSIELNPDTTSMARRFRTADAFPKKLSHIIDGLVVFMLSVQQIGNTDETLIGVLTLSGSIIFIQLFMYGISYANNKGLGFIMYGSKARIMDGYLGRENEIFGWICDKYMLPLSFVLEQLLGKYLDDKLIRPVSFMIFMPIIVGDSFGEIIGSTYGKQQIKVWGMGETNKKSYEGTAAVFISSFICLIGAVIYYKLNIIGYVLALVCSLISTVVELYAPRSTDNVFMLLANLACCILFASNCTLQ